MVIDDYVHKYIVHTTRSDIDNALAMSGRGGEELLGHSSHEQQHCAHHHHHHHLCSAEMYVVYVNGGVPKKQSEYVSMRIHTYIHTYISYINMYVCMYVCMYINNVCVVSLCGT